MAGVKRARSREEAPLTELVSRDIVGFTLLAQSVTGPAANTLRLVSFNCDGIVARLRNPGVCDYFRAESVPSPGSATLLLLQELKTTKWPPQDAKGVVQGPPTGVVRGPLSDFIKSWKLLAPSGLFTSLAISTSPHHGVATLKAAPYKAHAGDSGADEGAGVGAGVNAGSGAGDEDSGAASSGAAGSGAAGSCAAGSGAAPRSAPAVVRSECNFPAGVLRGMPEALRTAFLARIVTTWLDGIYIIVVNVYAPNSGIMAHLGSNLPLRASWDEKFLAYVKELNRDGGACCEWPSLSRQKTQWASRLAPFKGRVIVGGDLNVAGPRDVFPAGRIGKLAGTHPQEVQAFARLLEEGDLCDVWRDRHRDEVGFTWAHDADLQMRLDYFLVSSALQGLVSGVHIRMRGAPAGDHVPLVLDLRWPADEGASGGGAGGGGAGGGAGGAGGSH